MDDILKHYYADAKSLKDSGQDDESIRVLLYDKGLVVGFLKICIGIN